jgi:hypothetical protein
MKISKEERELWLEEWRQSGKSAWAYAKENGLCPQTFVNWTKPPKKSKTSLVEVPAEIISAAQQAPSEMRIEKGDVRIHIPLTAGTQELQTAFSALRWIFGGAQ